MRSRLIASALAIASWSAGAAGAYDAPNFDRPPVENDALSLSKRDREEIVSALTALTRNFPEEPRIDDDLREKAIGVALTLDPLRPEARDAHRRLLNGRKPSAVTYFTSLTTISEALWRHAEKLARRDAEPEDRRLAPLLMEIALLVKPGKADPDQLRAFQRASELAPVNWNRFLELTPEENPSNARAIALFRPVTEAEADAPPAKGSEPDNDSGNASTTGPAALPPVNEKNPGPAMVANDSPPGPATETQPDPETDSVPVSEIQIEQVALTYLANDRGKAHAVGGTASLEVREPTTDEASLFGLFIETGTDQSFEMRLTYDRDGPTVSGTDRAEKLIRRVFPRWPNRLFGELTFRPPAATEGAPESVQLGLPALLMLRSAFSGEPLNEAFGPAREYALAGELESGGKVVLPEATRVPEFVRAAVAMPIPPQAVFLPETGERGESQLIDAALAGDPGILLRPQLIAFGSVEDLQPLVFGETPPELLAAIEDFSAVQNLGTSMEVGAIARNAVVRERLAAIVEKWPGHLSARLLLAYGERPEDMGMTLEASRDAVYKVVRPLQEHLDQQVDGDSGGLVGKPGEMTAEASRVLFGLRSKVDPQAKDYLAAAERVLEAYETYFSLNNRDSSLGQQRLRELQQQIGEMVQEMRALGVETPLPEVE